MRTERIRHLFAGPTLHFQMRILTWLELAGFGAITLAAWIAGHAAAGMEAGLACALVVGGGSTVYLANAYAMGVRDEEEQDAERP